MSLISDIGLSIIFATILSHVVRAFKQPLILGYVLGGILLGSGMGLGLVHDEHSIELISEIGLILLLFIIGLEIDVRDFLSMGRAMFVLGAVQFLGCLGLGLAFFALLGYAGAESRHDLLYMSVAAALSSTLIVVKLLHDKFEVHSTPGRITVGLLVMQDLWAILFMAFQPSLQDPALGNIVHAVFQGVVLVAMSFAFSNQVLSRLCFLAAKSPELILLTSMGWCFLVAGAAEHVGLSREMGALIAGLSIAAFPYGADVTAKLIGIRDFFVTLFFVSLGVRMTWPTMEGIVLAALIVGFVIVSRFLTVVPAARRLGCGLRAGTLAAINLAPLSEFSLVIVSIGASLGHVTPRIETDLLTAMLLSSVVATYLITASEPVARAVLDRLGKLGIHEDAVDTRESRTDGDHGAHDIVILGCYREGVALLDELEKSSPTLKNRILVVDFNPRLRWDLERRGIAMIYGDLANPMSLHHLGLDQASVIVCPLTDTFLKGTTARRLLFHLRQIAREARIVMATDNAAQGEELKAAGASAVIVTTRAAGAQLHQTTLELLGHGPTGQVRPQPPLPLDLVEGLAA